MKKQLLFSTAAIDCITNIMGASHRRPGKSNDLWLWKYAEPPLTLQLQVMAANIRVNN